MSADAIAHGHDRLARRYADNAREVDGAAGVLRRLLLDGPAQSPAQGGERGG